MTRFTLRRMLAAAMALACLASAAHAADEAQGRPLTIRDVVSMLSFGAASLDPGGRWAVYERRGPYDTALAFDMGSRSVWTISELWISAVGDRTPPERLLPAGEGPGLLLGDWSPSGRRLLVYRLRKGRLEAGVVEMADRSVWWTGLAPDWGLTGSVAAWLDDDRLGLTVFPDGELPYLLRQPGSAQAAVARRWMAQREGSAATRTVIDTQAGVVSTEAPEARRALVLADVPNKTTRTLANGLIRDWAASPDGTAIAVLKAGPGIPIRPEAVRQLAPLERGRLELIETASGETRPLEGDWDVAGQLLRWTEDSSTLLIWVRRDGQAWAEGDLARVSPDGELALLDRDGLAPLPVGGDIDHLAGVKADWIGETPVLYARQPDGHRFDWYALSPGRAPHALTQALARVPPRLSAIDSGEALLFADGGLWTAGLDHLRRRTEAGVGVADALRPDRMKPVRLRVNSPPRQDWVLVLGSSGQISVSDARGSAPVGALDPLSETTVLDAESGAAIAVSRDHGVEVLTLSRRGETRDLDRVNAGFARLSMARPLRIDHLTPTGEPTTSWLFLPPDRAVENVKGVVVLGYPGGIDDGAYISPETLLYGPRAAMIAAEGYAVLSPSIPVAARGDGEIATFEKAVDRAVDAMIASHPGLPVNRMAFLGHSFGGYLSVAMATRSTRYRSYIAWSAATDLLSAWGEFVPTTRAVPELGSTLRERMGWIESNQGGMSGPPWTAPDAYLKASPYLMANQIRDPILLINAELDYVPPSQAELIFSAINRLGGRARLVTYWGEGHQNTSPANILDVYGQMIAWLDDTLRPDNISPPVPGDPPSAAPSPRSPPQS